MTGRLAASAATIGLTLGIILSAGTAYAETVGAAAAVRPASTGTPPGGAARTLQAGTKIESQERITTSGSGSLQVMFNDKSTLTIGPNSDMVIDQFVYNPGASGGKFAASLTKGALRFVGGQISHTDGAEIKTPVATLVVRGGAAFVTHNAQCREKNSRTCTTIVCTGGACTVRDRVTSRSFRLRVNRAIEVSSLGAVEFDARSVTLNDVAKGGSGNIVTGKSGNNGAKFTGRSTIEQTVLEQSPEPPPPPAPQ